MTAAYDGAAMEAVENAGTLTGTGVLRELGDGGCLSLSLAALLCSCMAQIH